MSIGMKCIHLIKVGISFGRNRSTKNRIFPILTFRFSLGLPRQWDENPDQRWSRMGQIDQWQKTSSQRIPSYATSYSGEMKYFEFQHFEKQNRLSDQFDFE